jgi:hypothetical protein
MTGIHISEMPKIWMKWNQEKGRIRFILKLYQLDGFLLIIANPKTSHVNRCYGESLTVGVL